MSQHLAGILVGASGLLAMICIGCGWILGLDEYKPQDEGKTAGFDGGDGGDVSCVPAESSAPVADDCGVFVATFGSDTNAGIKQSPVATIKVAIERAQFLKKPVFACAQAFEEEVKLSAGVVIYGGLDCTASWRYVGDTAKTTFAPPADIVPLTVSGSDGIAQITDVKVMAADATLPGGSSIAAVVDGAAASFVRVELIAGAGRDGTMGLTPSVSVGPMDQDDPAIHGNAGVKACTAASADNIGGAAKTNALCAASTGGEGGMGTLVGGGKGADGQPLPSPNPTNKGLGGAGDTGNDCEDGEKGQNGSKGAPGLGATELGALSGAGFVGASGKDGSAGITAQGGGGGGGAIGKAGCAGASGGSGGAGGCGGAGGKGGQAGGSSIALISLNATLSFDTVIMTASLAGHGGEGGDGQDGGIGGNGGNGGAGMGTFPACKGGQGGAGGMGGKGGGGRGGHALGIAYIGAVSSMEGVAFQPGIAGKGGAGADAPGNGAPGVQADVQKFLAQ